ncbi:MAG TPA: V-type ATP synthase subunit A [Deltaproteobacteria bacterium]|nr:V-type ATP synthase subunit A [Deltaproteobacteria bacterium]
MDREAEREIRGRIETVSGPTVVASGMVGARMHTTCLVGEAGLLGEIILVSGERATIQVYEDTTGLRLGEEVVSLSQPLLARLGPGLLSRVFDGVERPLEALEAVFGPFIGRGCGAEPLDPDRTWGFEPRKARGERVAPGDVLGVVRETEAVEHRVLVPPGMSGVVREIRSGAVTGREPLCTLEGGGEIGLYQEWPVRVPRPSAGELAPSEPLITGQRVFDTLLPVARGGTAAVPGGFGTGKTVVEQTLARFAKVDIVVYIGCGERGNEITDILTEFPELRDPETGLSLSERTVLIVNTSNMPVAAREASIFTGITIAEYYRDMGYHVALMADSISRWAEALREISSRLEEMPGEEGYPPYLATRLGRFYERAGVVRCLGDGGRTGSVTVISAVSPPGGDFSEPVTQASLRFAGTLWALDRDLAHRRHFPAISVEGSFSLYYDELADWYTDNVSPELDGLRARFLSLLQREMELKEVMQIIGMEGLQEKDRLVIEGAALAREVFLRQSAYDEVDAFCTPQKQFWMLKAIMSYLDAMEAALSRGEYLESLLENPIRAKLVTMHSVPNEGFADFCRRLIDELEVHFAQKRGEEGGR